MADLWDDLTKVPVEGVHRVATKNSSGGAVVTFDADGLVAYVSDNLPLGTGIGTSAAVADLHLLQSGTPAAVAGTGIAVQNDALTADRAIINLRAGATGLCQLLAGDAAAPQDGRMNYLNAAGIWEIFSSGSVVLRVGSVDIEAVGIPLMATGLKLIQRTDPANPPEGESIEYLTDGSGAVGAAGDKVIAMTESSVTRRTIVATFAGGTVT